jgi:hypothetical protein
MKSGILLAYIHRWNTPWYMFDEAMRNATRRDQPGTGLENGIPNNKPSPARKMSDQIA